MGVDLKKTLETFLENKPTEPKNETREQILIRNIYNNACEGNNKAVESLLSILDRQTLDQDENSPLNEVQNERAKNSNNTRE